MHKLFAIFIMLVTPFFILSVVNENPRVIILTDIENEPDNESNPIK